MNWFNHDRLRSIRVLVVAGMASGLFASPAFAFVFGEPLPVTPPGPGVGTPPPIDTLASAPEPASLIAGLFGVGLVGAYGAWRRKRQAN